MAGSPQRGGGAPSRVLPLVGLVVAAVLAGAYVLGRHTHQPAPGAGHPGAAAPATTKPRAAPPSAAAGKAAPRAAVSVTSVGGTSLTDRTSGGAAGAAADIFTALGSPDLFVPATATALLDRLAAPDARASLAGIAAPLDPASDPAGITAALAAGQPVLARNLVAAWRTTAFTPQAATVVLWVDGLLGTPALGKVSSTWETATVGLEWTSTGWRLESLSAVPGPAPTPADGGFATYTEAITATTGMRGWSYAPGN